tara:strand:+ start:58996 stop:60039 length:1044 start_codon:yes stop_codon:yes gene_type:complete
MKNFFVKLITLVLTVSYTAEASFYVVRSGDTLSTIAQKNIGEPIYSPNGSLAKIKALNPQIENPNVIRVGDIINLSAKTEIADNRSQRIPADEEQKIQKSVPEKIEDKMSCEPAVTIQSNPSEEVLHSLHLQVHTGLTTFSGIDVATLANANVVSKSDLSARASWRQHWTPNFHSDFFAEARSVGLQSISGSKSLVSENLNSNKLGLSIGHKAGERLTIDYGLEYGSEFFIRGASSTLISVESQPIPQFSTQIQYKIYELGSTSLVANLGGSYLGEVSTDNYTVKSGTSYQVGISVVKKMSDQRTFSAQLAYSDRKQDTSLVLIHEKSVFGTVSFSIPLFEGGGNSK